MKHDFIEIKNASENNLKNISCNIPKGKITIFTGVSGSGKSSLVFDTIAAEAGRQLNETFSSFARQFLPKYKRPEAESIKNLSCAVIVDQKKIGGNIRSTIGTITDINPMIRTLFANFALPKIGGMSTYSFNDPHGMCPECSGVGQSMVMDIDKVLDMNLSLSEGAIKLGDFKVDSFYYKALIGTGYFDPNKKLKDYTKEEIDNLLYAKPQKVDMDAFKLTTEGLVSRFNAKYINTEKELGVKNKKIFEEFSTVGKCSSCEGKRYNKEVLSSKIGKYNIYDLTSIELDELLITLEEMKDGKMDTMIDMIKMKIGAIVDVGLGYLPLDRETSTLSGGESQRIKMIKYLSSDLSQMMYIFDEPSTGLHPHDVHRLNELLEKIRDEGNTVLVVEHDPDVIKVADHIIDIGPKAGSGGGNIMYEGSYEGLLKSDTVTGKFLSKKEDVNVEVRKATEFYESRKSSLHNLKNVSLKIPKGLFTVVTGVAGSGKSTIVNDVFIKDYPETVVINQTPIHGTSRSNPVTYTGIMNTIRKCFAKANDVSESLFSYNSEGACTECGGKGIVTLNMSFMDNTEAVCSACNGSRYKDEVLHYEFKGKNIVDVMDMTIEDAAEFFDEKEIKKKLNNMIEVGLGYLTLGQPLSTISGGEGQRLKIADELNKKGNIYVLDEPTTGLHLSDVQKIIDIINSLVDKGNTVIVIEHNTEVIKRADYVVDMGLLGGNKGGEILFEGEIKDLRKNEKSLTAKYI